ncbi:MAG: ribosome biogenesis GTP-binding protein YihA/YsxC [Syntrophorhabdaceae bacterium]
MRILNANYEKSVSSPAEVSQENLPEICFVGRSNVGKSSLINILVNQRVARTSSRPGATRMINIYKVSYEIMGLRKVAIFSDFPGFGYARVSRDMALSWQKMVENYLPNNPRIKDIIWLFDVRRDPDELDRMMLDWLVAKDIPFTPVLTKIDKETQGNIMRKSRAFGMFLEGRDLNRFSAKTGYGKKELIAHISGVLENG